MSIIRGGGDVAQAIRGTFTGDGTATVNLQTGFEPDVIVIDSGTSTDVAGFQGLIAVCIVKGVFGINYYHNSDSDTTERQYTYSVKAGDDPWCNNAGSFRSCASYSGGVLTVTNKITNNANVYFANGQTYTWTAYKYNQ